MKVNDIIKILLPEDFHHFIEMIIEEVKFVDIRAGNQKVMVFCFGHKMDFCLLQLVLEATQ
jgi:hypothetical protein